jgi:hypothetical protein
MTWHGRNLEVLLVSCWKRGPIKWIYTGLVSPKDRQGSLFPSEVRLADHYAEVTDM